MLCTYLLVRSHLLDLAYIFLNWGKVTDINAKGFRYQQLGYPKSENFIIGA